MTSMLTFGFGWSSSFTCVIEITNITRGGSRTAAASKVELFVIIVNDWKPLTIITKSSTFDAPAVLDPPLITVEKICFQEEISMFLVTYVELGNYIQSPPRVHGNMKPRTWSRPKFSFRTKQDTFSQFQFRGFLFGKIHSFVAKILAL